MIIKVNGTAVDMIAFSPLPPTCPGNGGGGAAHTVANDCQKTSPDGGAIVVPPVGWQQTGRGVSVKPVCYLVSVTNEED